MKLQSLIQLNYILHKCEHHPDEDVLETADELLQDLEDLATSYGAKKTRSEISPMEEGSESFLDLVLLFPNKMAALNFAIDGMSRFEYCMFSYFECFEEDDSLDNIKSIISDLN
jgi:hypothetical protein